MGREIAVKVPDRDPAKWHPLLRERWALMGDHLYQRVGKTIVNEGYRADIRQAWLYGAGRTAEMLLAVGVPGEFARPNEEKVTNAWSAKLSAHGWELDDGTPASCALDLVPLGADDKPWTKDDPWDDFVRVVAELAPKCKLVHFSKPGKKPWDKPHVQLVEWSDGLHRLVLA